MRRREIRRMLRNIFDTMVAYTEHNIITLNDEEFRKELGVESLKPVEYVKFKVIAETA